MDSQYLKCELETNAMNAKCKRDTTEINSLVRNFVHFSHFHNKYIRTGV